MNFKPFSNTQRNYYQDISYTGLEQALMQIVDENSKEIYSDSVKLKQALEFSDISALHTLQIIIMSHVNGFQDLINNDVHCSQANIERYIHNAIYETGFTRSTILSLTSCIAISVGSAINCAEFNDVSEKNECSFVVPMSFYEDELKKIESAIKRKGAGGISQANLERLQILSSAGIPKAEYLLGTLLLWSDETDDPQTAINLLENAAEDGIPEAAAVLGDYYYQSNYRATWLASVYYYTGYGSLALSDDRRTALKNIFQYSLFNKRLLLGCVALTFAIFFAVVLMPMVSTGGIVSSRYTIAGIITFTLSLICNLVSFYLYNLNPYADKFWVPGLQLLLCVLYAIFRFAF